MAKAKYFFLGVGIETPAGLLDNNTEEVLEMSSLKTSTVAGTAQRWDLTFRQTDAVSSELLAAKIKVHQGRHRRGRPFDFPCMQYPGIEELTFAGTIDVREKADAGATTVKVKTSAGTITIPLGYLIQFSTGKIYHVEEAADLTTTTGELKIYPSLRNDLTTAARVVLSPTMRVKWGTRDSTYNTNVENGLTYRPTFTVIEAV